MPTIECKDVAAGVPEIARAFHFVAKTYETFRPTYPSQCSVFFQNELHIGPNTKVLDLAAGTGKVSRLLAPLCGSENLIAVEPLDGMRNEYKRALPQVTAIAGTAENIPLPDASVDVVVVGDAFHWFREEGLNEIYRVLVPGGRLCMLWNDPDVAAGPQFMKKLFFKVVGSRKPMGTPTYWDGKWKTHFSQLPLLSPLMMHRITYNTVMNPEQVVKFVASLSWIAHLPETEQQKVEEEVRHELQADEFSRGKKEFDVPYNTDIHWCTKM